MVQSQLSRLLKYSVRFSRFYAELPVNCTKVTLEDLLLAAKQIGDSLPIKFVLVGDGPNRQTLIQSAESHGLRNVLFIPFQPRARLPDVLSSADLTLVSQITEVANDSLPSKTFPLLACGRPILAIVDDNSELAQLIERYKAGVHIAPGIPTIIADTVRKLLTEPSLLDRMGRQGRQYAVQLHSRKQATLIFQSVLSTLERER